MVRKRGGGMGRGQDQGGKRQATTPVGGVYKDSRRNIQGDEDFDDDDNLKEILEELEEGKYKNKRIEIYNFINPDKQQGKK